MRIWITLFIVFFLSSCAPSRQAVPPGVVPQGSNLTQQDIQVGEQARSQLIEQFPVSKDREAQQRVRSILDKLILASRNRADWQTTVLVGDDVENAAATRGNQVFVWTGMLRAVRSDDELAAVLAHEAAHILAGHVIPTQDEVLRKVLAQVAGGAAQQLSSEQSLVSPQIAGSLASQAAHGFLVNPYSRTLELEADRIGLFLMADAGFDPRAAAQFWERAGGSSGKLVEFLSTHPPSTSRSKQIAQYLPEALSRYRKS